MGFGFGLGLWPYGPMAMCSLGRFYGWIWCFESFDLGFGRQPYELYGIYGYLGIILFF
jgi:hypothetical protein